MRQQIGIIIRELASQKETEIIEGTACSDHIHLIARIPPKYSVAHIIGFLKDKSAIKMHSQFSKQHRTTHKAFWSRGYFVDTIGIDEDTITKYVQNQWKTDKYVDGDQLDLRW